MTGFDLFVPSAAIAAVADKAIAAAKSVGGRACGWQAFEIARIEAGIPRFGADMDETNLAPEAHRESRDQLQQRLLHRAGSHRADPHLWPGGKIVPWPSSRRRPEGASLKMATNFSRTTKKSATSPAQLISPDVNANIALGYVRKEVNKTVRTYVEQVTGDSSANNRRFAVCQRLKPETLPFLYNLVCNCKPNLNTSIRLLI